MSTAAFDNNILVWGVRRQAPLGQEYRLAEAAEFFERLKAERAILLVPAVVVSEYLAFLPEHRHTESLLVLQRRFRVLVYDTRAAMEAAKLWRLKKFGADREYERHRELFPDVTRAKIKADLQIIGTCIANRVDVLYSADDPLISLAEGYVRAERMFQGEMRQANLEVPSEIGPGEEE